MQPDRAGGSLPTGGGVASTEFTSTEAVDAALFRSIWEQYRAFLYAICRRYLENSADAEDALSELAMRLWHRRPLLKGVSNTMDWLGRMAQNLCIDIQRSRARWGRPSASLEPLEAEELLPADDQPSPEQALLGSELLQLLSQRIDTLPEILRETARLYFTVEMPYADIAELLGVSQANIRKRIERARLLLRLDEVIMEVMPDRHRS